jgi:hypothetical protein
MGSSQRSHVLFFLGLSTLITVMASCEQTALLFQIEQDVDFVKRESVAAPQVSPAAGGATSDQSATLSVVTGGATIYYTTDGSAPSTDSAVYTGPIELRSFGRDLTLKAYAIAPGMNVSPVTTVSYSILFPLLSMGPSGGTIFYDKGDDVGGWRFLEAAPIDQSAGILWDDGDGAATGVIGTDIGDGESNTISIVAALGNGTYAAKMCSDLELNGFDDWFLPSKDELNILFQERVAIGGFSTSVADHYWTSSELTTFGGVSAHIKNFGNGDDKSGTKNVVGYRVRAVRAF